MRQSIMHCILAFTFTGMLPALWNLRCLGTLYPSHVMWLIARVVVFDGNRRHCTTSKEAAALHKTKHIRSMATAMALHIYRHVEVCLLWFGN